MSIGELLTHTIARSGRPDTLLRVEEDATVNGRKLALDRAFVNLMDNADKHGAGLIEITVRHVGAEVTVSIDDAGPGVPADQRERIFERFATAHTRGGRTAGTGLGLALVAQTVAAHGGHVACTDRPEGGARFLVTLPAESV
ncbi:sensor histidine kinase [Antrihabitans cavernicola]|uniref:sensor histidine kinase n=1 Tax=Antrihabitans cavernicola TaxID=2495913 RepID=UPI001F41BEEA|nr:ATP-binding protein [Spelaeibacter cavernicola]